MDEGTVRDSLRDDYEGWTILEVMGHRRMGGFVREVQIAGAGFLRIDVPMADGQTLTQFYPPASIYAITPTTEEMARAVAKFNEPQPVHTWELPAAKRPLIDAMDTDLTMRVVDDGDGGATVEYQNAYQPVAMDANLGALIPEDALKAAAALVEEDGIAPAPGMFIGGVYIGENPPCPDQWHAEDKPASDECPSCGLEIPF